MATVVPPFERFYEAHRTEVLGFLGRRLGRDRAEDAFQETFLRALRAYPRLEHGEHLRAWVLTIASRIVLDDVRRRRPPTTNDIDELPPKERAAVVLRYGFDLPYDEIAAALGSSEAAARQAASSGVRRLRERSKES